MNTFATRLAASYRTGWRVRTNFSLGLRASLLIGFGIILGLLLFLDLVGHIVQTSQKINAGFRLRFEWIRCYEAHVGR